MESSNLPTSWAEVPLIELVTQLGRGKSPKYSPKDQPFYAVNQRCIQWGQIELQFRKPTLKDWAEAIPRDYVLVGGEVLINSTGTGTLGRVNIWPRNVDGTNIPDSHLTLIRTREEIHANYIRYFLSSTQGQKIISSATTGSTNQIELNRSKLSSSLVPLPPLPEQKRIVEKISSTFAKIESVRQSLEKVTGFSKEIDDNLVLMEKMKSSILDKAFLGLLVPQKDTEGTGHELIGSIRTQVSKTLESESKKAPAKRKKTK